MFDGRVSPAADAERTIPLEARIRLGHAVVQAVADDERIDVLHIKGYAVEEGLYRAHRTSTDIDLLVRPRQAMAFLAALERHGWRRVTSFRTGSIFEHAAVMWHDAWGYADVHRVLPGMSLAAAEAFDRLWATSGMTTIADVPCRVPSRAHQAMVIVLHDARTPGVSSSDVQHLREVLPDHERLELRAEAARFGAEVAWAAATGRLEDFRDHPEYPLWLAIRDGASRSGLLRARVRSARTALGKASILAGAALPNRDHLRMTLGHEPRPADYVGDVIERVRAALRGLSERLGSRRERSGGAR